MPPNRKRAHGQPCPYCQRPMQRHHPKLEPTRDHHVPQSKGGTDIIIACIQCNMIKADMMPEQWTAFMAQFDGWWKFSKSELRHARRAFSTPGLEAGVNIRRERKEAGLTSSGKPKPVIVPPGLIWKRADLIAQTVELDAQLRGPTEPAGAVPMPDAPNPSPTSENAPAPHSGDLA